MEATIAISEQPIKLRTWQASAATRRLAGNWEDAGEALIRRK
jgi:hypothetical protein